MNTLFKSLVVFVAMLCLAFTANAQDEWDQANTTNTTVTNTTDKMYRAGNVGIGTNEPKSTLSVNGDGSGQYGIYVTAPRQGASAAGLVSVMPAMQSNTDWNRGVLGSIVSGRGYSVGVQGYAYNSTPSSSGRAYGVYATAGNSSINYGLYATLRGNNRGAAVFGNAAVSDSSPDAIFNGKWAGYFLGRSYFSDQVGIGTNTPVTMLDIHGDASVNDNRIILRGGNDPHHVLAWKDDFVGRKIDGPVLHGFAGGALGSNTWGVEKIALQWFDDGKIVIGNVTKPGDYKLYVEDGILTEKLKIAISSSSAWADYVFQDDYELKSLEEVEQHIQEKGHLHNTPSAKQIVEEGGIELKSITINQQEKIEELYLHLIELNKSHEVLESKYEALLEKLNQ